MDTCPNFNVNTSLEDTLSKIPTLNTMVDELRNNNAVFSDECPILDTVGGKKTSKKGKHVGKKRNTKGGSLTASQIKSSIQFALLVIFVYMTATANSSITGIQSGLMSIWSGECSNMSNRLWSMVGLNNPVCEAHNRLMSIIYRALVGDVTAVSTIVGMVGLVTAAPFLAMSSVKIATYYIASKLPLQLMSQQELDILRQDAYGALREIQDAQGQLPTNQQAQLGTFLTTTIGAAPAAIENQPIENQPIENQSSTDVETMDGGRKVRRVRKSKKSIKKTKKSKRNTKSKKTNKTKKAKKSRKH